MHLSTSNLPPSVETNRVQSPSPAKHPNTRVPTSIGCLVFKERLKTYTRTALFRTATVCFEGLQLCSAAKPRSTPFCKKISSSRRNCCNDKFANAHRWPNYRSATQIGGRCRDRPSAPPSSILVRRPPPDPLTPCALHLKSGAAQTKQRIGVSAMLISSFR